MLEAFLTSTVLVAIAEIGDKTQLLSFALTAKLRRPRAIIAGILVATLANHAVAGAVGAWVARFVDPETMRMITAIAFAAFGLWALKPDTLDDEPGSDDRGAFLTTVIAFFFAEMGDKTQFATIALGARFESLGAVVVGTTLGMMIANVPAVLLGQKLAHRIPAATVRKLAATLFLATAAWTWFAH
jgi:putative Ca2+/H+ antiporter (TMEM165/GDT1 family)